MLQFFEPTQQLVAALILGSCTLFAAIVNAVAQVRVARDARRKSQPPPRETRRVRRWVVLGAGFALALGWSATVAHDRAQAADGTGGQALVGAGVASLFGQRSDARNGTFVDGLAVALLHLRRPLTDRQVVRLLHQYDLRAYAIDLRLSDESEAWQSVPVGIAPAESMPRARADAVRRAWQEACAYESVMASAAGRPSSGGHPTERDTLAMRLVRARAVEARAYAERLEEDEAVIHALRVLASAAAASRAAQDSAVLRAEILRYDSGWTARTQPQPDGAGCDVVRLGENGTVAPDA